MKQNLNSGGYRSQLAQPGALVVLAIILACAGGCASYSARSMGAADFRAMGITQEAADEQTDISIARRLERQPLAAFPTSIAVVRVQEQGYCSATARGYGHGSFTVVTTRDVESDDAFDKLAALPMVNGIAPLNRIVLPEARKLETPRGPSKKK